jgi:hypothetical protein
MRLVVSGIVVGLVAFGVVSSAGAEETSSLDAARPVVVAQAGGQNPGGESPAGRDVDPRTGGGNATMVPTAAPSGGGTQVGSQTEGQTGGGGPSGTGPASGDTPTTNVRGTGPSLGDLPWLLVPLALLAVLGAVLMTNRRGSADRSTVGSGRRE